MEMKEYDYQIKMKVRDYECDLQGVVNNANYQRYMEHTRHEFMGTLGKNFGRLHEEGIDAFVSKVEIRFKHSLRSGDRFLSCMNLRREGVKLVFEQDIYRLDDLVLVTTGRVETVIVENGRLTRGDYFDELLKTALPPNF
jgi:acyl-CoA thioester hydrolase